MMEKKNPAQWRGEELDLEMMLNQGVGPSTKRQCSMLVFIGFIIFMIAIAVIGNVALYYPPVASVVNFPYEPGH